MWLPTYMKDVLNFNLDKSEYYVFLPYVAIFLGQLVVGKIADFVIEKKFARVVVVRKFCQTMGTLVPGIFLGLLCLNPPIYACLILMVIYLCTR